MTSVAMRSNLSGAGDVDRCQLLLESFATVPAGKAEWKRTTPALLEMEIGMMLKPYSSIISRLEVCKPVRGTALDGRVKLFKTFVELENVATTPDDYEDFVEAFTRLVGENVEKTRSASLRTAFAILRVELAILAAVHSFKRNPSGAMETDLGEAFGRFRENVQRNLLQYQETSSSSFSASVNERIKEVKTLRTPDAVLSFVQAFHETSVIECARQMVIEIQYKLYGTPRVSDQLVTGAFLEAAAHDLGIHNFNGLTEKSIMVPPTPARDLNRANRALQKAAGPDPLSALREKRVKIDLMPDDEEIPVAARSVLNLKNSVQQVASTTTTAKQQPLTPKRVVSEVQPSLSVSSVTRQPATQLTQTQVLEDEEIAAGDTRSAPNGRIQPKPEGTPMGNTKENRELTPNSGQKQRRRWTAEEDQALQNGVSKYGVGQWHLILADKELAAALNERTNVNLKDRWRNLAKSG